MNFRKKTILSLLFFLALTSLSTTLLSQDRDISENVLKALQTNDINLHLQYTPQKDDINYMINFLHMQKEQDKKEMENMISEKRVNEFKENFVYVRNQIIKTGVDLNKAVIMKILHKDRRFIKLNFDSCENKIERTDIHLIIKIENSLYELIIDDCLKTKRGWVMFDRLKWFGKYE